MSKEVVVRIKDGKAIIAPTGYTGAQCLKITADIELAMGATTSSVPTPEMRAVEATLKITA